MFFSLIIVDQIINARMKSTSIILKAGVEVAKDEVKILLNSVSYYLAVFFVINQEGC